MAAGKRNEGQRQTMSRSVKNVFRIALLLACNFGCDRPGGFDSTETAFTYTADDGATYFNSVHELKPPISPDGKPAVIAHLGRISADGRIEVIWLERRGEGKNAIEAKTPGLKEWKSFPSESAKLAWASTLKSQKNQLFTYLN